MESSLQTMSHQLNIKVVSLSLGVFAAVAFVLCVLYGIVFPSKLHLLFFEVLPWVRWLDPISFVTGLVESFVFGLTTGAIFIPIYNYFVKRIS